MAADLSTSMLDLARYNIEVECLNGRVQLDHVDAKQLPYEDGMFQSVISNSIIHHVPDPLVVLRSARDLPEYGPDFRYGHYVQVRSLPRLVGGAVSVGAIFGLAQLRPTRKLLLSYRKSGEGPSVEQRQRSRFRVVFLGQAGDRRVKVEVSGGDPGYTETSKMLAESALTLAHDRERLGPAGVVTSTVAMGEPLLKRLREAGMRFDIVES